MAHEDARRAVRRSPRRRGRSVSRRRRFRAAGGSGAGRAGSVHRDRRRLSGCSSGSNDSRSASPGALAFLRLDSRQSPTALDHVDLSAEARRDGPGRPVRRNGAGISQPLVAATARPHLARRSAVDGAAARANGRPRAGVRHQRRRTAGGRRHARRRPAPGGGRHAVAAQRAARLPRASCRARETTRPSSGDACAG